MAHIDDDVARERTKAGPREPDLDLRLAGAPWGLPPEVTSLSDAQQQDVPAPPPPEWYDPPDTDG